MSSFSPTNVAFEGFRVAKRAPVAVILWGLVTVVATVVGIAALFGLTGFALVDLFRGGEEPATFDQIVDFLVRLAPGVLALVAVLMLANSVTVTAMNRSVLRPEELRMGYLRLGGDEMRVLAVQLVLALLLIFAYLIPLAAVIGLGAAASDYSAAATVVIYLVGVPGVVVLFIWLMVRLSLAVALSFDTGRIDPFGSWRLTKGRFWPLLGAYLLAIVLSFAVNILGSIMAVVISSPFMIGAFLSGVGEADMSGPALIALLAGQLVSMALSAFVSAFCLTIIVSPSAAIYRALSGEHMEEVF